MSPSLQSTFISCLAEAAYEGYRRESGGKSIISGQPIPPWAELQPAIQQCWRGAAVGILELLDPNPSHPSSRLGPVPLPVLAVIPTLSPPDGPPE
jgi:hypothetical protein